MSLEDIRSECSDVAAWLQPYADGELAEEEQEHVAPHLETCKACRTAVSEQMWVRATLRSAEREQAPQALRAKVLLALDEVDDEIQAETQSTAPQPSFWARARDLMRGGLIMLPAAAVAGALFLVVRGGLEPVPTAESPPLTAALTEAPRHGKAAESGLPDLAKLQPKVEFPIQVAQPGSVPRVELVGALLDRSAGGVTPPGARLRYRVFKSGRATSHVIDRQRASGGPLPVGRPVTFKGQRYLVGQFDGTPMVHYVDGGVAHMLQIEGELPIKDIPEGGPDYTNLLDLADHLKR